MHFNISLPKINEEDKTTVTVLNENMISFILYLFKYIQDATLEEFFRFSLILACLLGIWPSIDSPNIDLYLGFFRG